jgi:hypothetical protein
MPIRLHQGNLALAEERVRLEPGEWRWIDLRASPVPLTFADDAVTGRSERVLAGVARDDSTGRPVAGVDVVLEGTDKAAVTNDIGRYAMNDVPTGVRTLLFRSIGYRPVRLGLRLVEADTVWADARLVKEGVVLDPIEVTARPPAPRGLREGFEERRAMGFGRFIDSTELRRNQHLRLADMLRRHRVGVVRIRDMSVAPRERWITVAANRRKGDCVMKVILNGTTVYDPDRDGNWPTDINEFDLASLESVEVYQGFAQMPAAFGGALSGCGVVVLWSRRG